MTAVRERYRAKREALLPALEAVGLRDAGGDATFFLWMDAGPGADALAARWLEAGVVVAPGSFFGAPELPAHRARADAGGVRAGRRAHPGPCLRTSIAIAGGPSRSGRSRASMTATARRPRRSSSTSSSRCGRRRCSTSAAAPARSLRELIARGLDVLGVELDERMAGIAREHGVEVELGAFETWDDRGRTFDLITCGDAWHWIDPVRGWRKIGRVLRPGGTVARFWNHNEVDEPLREALAEGPRARPARDRAPHPRAPRRGRGRPARRASLLPVGGGPTRRTNGSR